MVIIMAKAKILVVDDNAVNLAAVERDLEDKYEVIPMIAGSRAIKFLCCEKADLVLLDVQMPVMSGIETLQEIRKLDNGQTVPVIFLTASDDQDIAAKGTELGIVDYITKPFEKEDLRNRIAHVLKKMGILQEEA